jgi:hypothetical protein
VPRAARLDPRIATRRKPPVPGSGVALSGSARTLQEARALSTANAAAEIREAMGRLKGVQPFTHRFGGTEYRPGRREWGRVHGNEMVDGPFPRRVRDEVMAHGPAEEHHRLPRTGWVSCCLRRPEDVDHAISLLERSYVWRSTSAAGDRPRSRRTNHKPDLVRRSTCGPDRGSPVLKPQTRSLPGGPAARYRATEGGTRRHARCRVCSAASIAAKSHLKASSPALWQGHPCPGHIGRARFAVYCPACGLEADPHRSTYNGGSRPPGGGSHL